MILFLGAGKTRPPKQQKRKTGKTAGINK